jgi:hypothetical protein
MSMLINKKNTYAILPYDKYDIVTYKPSKVMDDKSYTLFARVKFIKQTIDNNDGGILCRPGKHFGFLFQNPKFVKVSVWLTKDGEDTPFIDMHAIPDSDFEKFNDMVLIDNKEEKIIKYYYNGSLIIEINYKDYDHVKKYADNPFYLGAGNPFASSEEHCNYGSFEYETVGLIDTIVDPSEISEIPKHVIKNEVNLIDKNYKYAKNLVFYYDFENVTRYKIWDVSNNGNFLTKHHKLESENLI